MSQPSEKEIREVAIHTIEKLMSACNRLGEGLVGELLEEDQPSWKDPNNRTLGIDKFAHILVELAFAEAFSDRIEIYGEEKKGGLSLAEPHKVHAVVDPIDGTDLVLRDFGNWCCAMAFFVPKDRRILSAVVGHSSGDIYYANADGAFVRPRIANGKKHRDHKLHRSSQTPIDLRDASICFYGQKPSSFLEVTKHNGFLGKLEELRDAKGSLIPLGQPGIVAKKPKMRIYNFGGNPMMVKIPTGAVDAVFSLSGADPHDVVPGSYIAVQSGALLTDLDGKQINLVDLLLNSAKRVPYILSGSEVLSGQLTEVLSKVPTLEESHSGGIV